MKPTLELKRLGDFSRFPHSFDCLLVCENQTSNFDALWLEIVWNWQVSKNLNLLSLRMLRLHLTEHQFQIRICMQWIHLFEHQFYVSQRGKKGKMSIRESQRLIKRSCDPNCYSCFFLIFVISLTTKNFFPISTFRVWKPDFRLVLDYPYPISILHFPLYFYKGIKGMYFKKVLLHHST